MEGDFSRVELKLVLQVAAQNPVFDQDVAPGRLAFVVDIQGAAAAADGAVVDHGAEFAGDLLADPAAEGGDALAVEIGFESVADGFVQQNSRPAGAEHHGHFAGRGVHRVEHGDGFARGFGGEVFGSLLVEEESELYTARRRRHVRAADCRRFAVPGPRR